MLGVPIIPAFLIPHPELMDNWITKYFLPFLVITLIAALYFDSSSVEKVDLDASYSEPVAVAPVQPRTASRPPVTRKPQTSSSVTKSRLAIGERYNTLNDLEADLRAQVLYVPVTLAISGQLLLPRLLAVVMRSSL